jgi:acetolactate synthase I/II/III large subunit
MAAPGDREKSARVGRRHFLKSAALGGVVAAAVPVVRAQTEQSAPGSTSSAAAPTGPAKVDPSLPRPAGATPRSEEISVRDRSVTYSSCGGDYMVDVLRSLGIEYFAATPGNTFMGIHEAVINYGMLTQPNLRFITTMHEEASVAMSHGYSKIEGKPMACMMHTTGNTARWRSITPTPIVCPSS